MSLSRAFAEWSYWRLRFSSHADNVRLTNVCIIIIIIIIIIFFTLGSKDPEG